MSHAGGLGVGAGGCPGGLGCAGGCGVRWSCIGARASSTDRHARRELAPPAGSEAFAGEPTPLPLPRAVDTFRWDRAAPQPLHYPLALALLQAALADADVTGYISRAPGDLGVTLILAARREPFKQWAAHLASFGAQVRWRAARVVACMPCQALPGAARAHARAQACVPACMRACMRASRRRHSPLLPQAGVVAESPYYKLLIGRALGYSEENILHHIRARPA